MQKIRKTVFILIVISLTLFSWINNIHAESNNDQLDNHVKLANAARKSMLDVEKPNVSQIKNILSKRDLEGLEKIYDNYLHQYQSDVRYEILLLNAYDLFSPANTISLSDLDYWVSKTGSYIAYTARGRYKERLGFAARGTKFIIKTPEYKIDDMKELHSEAAKDLQIAVNKNPLLMPAYFYLISIAKASDMPFTPKEILDQAVKQDNRTYTVRVAYMGAITPSWGGSYEKMSDFAKQTIQYADVNPSLWTLQGEVFAEQGGDYWRENNFAQALEAFNLALKYGDRTTWLRSRAGCFWQLGQKDKAVEDYKKILYYDPKDEDAKTMLQSLQRQMSH